MAAYILLSIILLILALLVFSENKNTKPPKTGKSPEELKLEEIKRADAEKRLKEEAKRAKEETRKRLEASKKAEKEQKAAEAQARKEEEERERREAEQRAHREAEEARKRREEKKAEAKKKAEEEEARKREAVALKAEEERKAREKEEAQRLEAEKRAAEKAAKEAQEREAAEAEAKKEAEAAAEKEKETVAELPAYPAFDHSRLVEMGLSDEEATDFVKELIPQIEAQLPLLEEAMQKADFQQMERLTHSIKGSATNIGTGGVSDLLVDYNTYLKSGDSITLAKAYHEELTRQVDKLKAQYL
ncbi:Hpt domain-containing protein [Sulfurovum riftiae]|uniref:HPt domain-containing protein n=1 Tax=Sulfurovum riftiae TaxID=1630136 RepID=A0A151CEK7_9BACT|nr:Hpt domain-containing protein [Sulfurovum riftiae]KYJ85904.1 hypothetical protein AS592_04755 [Sulfurovum riftiae]